METKIAKLLDGKAIAAKIQQELSVAITQLQPKIGRSPGLAVLMVGDNQHQLLMYAIKKKLALKLV